MWYSVLDSKLRNMREDDIEIIYKNLHLNFVNKYFKNNKERKDT